MRRAAALLIALAACHHGGKGAAPAGEGAETQVPATAGDSMLSLLPAGPDAILEIDVARVRANPTLGPVIEASGATPPGLGFDPLRDLDVAVVAAYHVGQADAATLYLLRGARIDARQVAAIVPDAEVVDEHTVLGGPAEARLGIRGGPDREILRLRDRAVPAGAPGATLRLAARLGPEARIAAAHKLEVAEVPATISMWVDVADDLALVAFLEADDEASARRVAEQMGAAAVRAGHMSALILGVMPPEGRSTTTVTGGTARMTWVVNPRELAGWAKLVADVLAKRPQSPSGRPVEIE